MIQILFILLLNTILIPQLSAAESDYCLDVRSKYNPKTASQYGEYNMACCSALNNEADNSFTHLEKAISKGFRDLDWLRADDDLKVLHSDPRWENIIDLIQQNLDKYLSTINAELYQIFSADQNDRFDKNLDWGIVSENDAQRRKRVDEILVTAELKHSDDYYHAAMVFQHGNTADHYQKAFQLSLKAVEMDSTNSAAKWLSCATEDRYLHKIGEAQVWGTQFRMEHESGLWTMEPFNRSAKSDTQRREMGVRVLAESQARLEQMNR